MNLLRPERLEPLARDHALGVLRGGARRRFGRLLAEQPDARAALARWQAQLGTLDAAVPAVAPSPALWAGIEQRLFAAPRKTAPWWSALWSGRTLGSALAGAALCAVLLRVQPGWVGLEPAADTLPASYVGLLHDTAGRPTLLASSRRHGQVLTVKLLQPLAVPEGRVAQLWALPADGSAPFPVGVLPARGSAALRLAAPSEALFFKVARLGVSFEAAPAAAGSVPSGPYVLAGDCVKLW
jgi:anti-sigma-K factor RskA